MSFINGLGQGLSQFIQSLQGSNNGSSSGSSASQGISQFLQSLQGANGSSSSSSGGSSLASSISQDIAKLTGHAGKHHQHALFKKISEAVVGALNSSSTSASSSTSKLGPFAPGANSTATDPNQKIENAIVNILKSSTNTTNSSGAVSDSDNDAKGATSGQALLQSLQQNGVTPEQFRNDLLAALQQAQGSTQAFGSLESNFPAGLLVNTVG